MIKVGKIQIDAETEFNADVKMQLENDVEYYNISFSSPAEILPDKVNIKLDYPILDIHNKWSQARVFDRAFEMTGVSKKHVYKSNLYAPVEIFTNIRGENKLCIACSDAVNPIRFAAYVCEERASVECVLTLFEEDTYPISEYKLTIRIDTGEKMYYDALSDVSKWWEQMYKPASVPPIAKKAMYSTWYSFHQNLNSDELIKQCIEAKKIKCESIIIDDGWQTEDNRRGYKYCGDWNLCKTKIPDMKDLTEQIHKIGMKVILWYTVPFIGVNSNMWGELSGKFINNFAEGVDILDPRFPDVRNYLVEKYRDAVIKWDIDGLKLDFLEKFEALDSVECDNGRDCISLQTGFNKLMTEIKDAVTEIKPDFMIEFRQPYAGPVMRQYGNIFRASDCPNDFITNRVRTLDLRLLCGNTAVHSDMIMWNLNDTPENAAMQIISVLFAVPQISVDLFKITEEQYAAVKYWLDFSDKHQKTLLEGKLMPFNQCSNYSTVIAESSSEIIGVVYDNAVLNIPCPSGKKVYIINGYLNKKVFFYSETEKSGVECVILDFAGREIKKEKTNIQKGINLLEIPLAGTAIINL